MWLCAIHSQYFDNIHNASMYVSVNREENKNSFYNKKKKKTPSFWTEKNICIQNNFFFGCDEVYSHIGNNIFFLSLAPLFISDRLKKQFIGAFSVQSWSCDWHFWKSPGYKRNYEVILEKLVKIIDKKLVKKSFFLSRLRVEINSSFFFFYYHKKQSSCRNIRS